MIKDRLLIVAGPTASGKSALALRLAEELGGVVINADSMQVYREMHVLSARPSAADEARAPHRLYGVMSAAEVCSAARWRDLAKVEIEAAWAAGRLPIVTGGTGLYINALTEGISPIPEVPDAVRREARALFATLGNAVFHDRLAARDPVMAARLGPGNSQRLVRAWEVLEATGRSLADWQALPPQGALVVPTMTVLLLPERDGLYARIDARFREMVAQGGLAEVAALDNMGLAPDLPAMKALGIPELRRHLHGMLGLDEAVGLAQQATRHYAKRQVTWFRHRSDISALRLREKFSESLLDKTFPIIRGFLLTADS